MSSSAPTVSDREHGADPFSRRVLDEALDVDVLERLLTRDADEFAGAVVDPVVVGARHPPGVAEAVVGDRPAAVPADIEEGAGNAVVAADHDDGPPGDLHRREVPGGRDVDRQGHHQRVAPEQGLDLALVPRRVAVLVGGDLHHRRGESPWFASTLASRRVARSVSGVATMSRLPLVAGSAQL